MLSIVKTLETKLEKLFESENTGHDIFHLKRVYNVAMEIQKSEGGDPYVVAVGALVHDIHRLLSSKLGYYVSAQESIDQVREILIDCNVDLEKLDHILYVVKYHDCKENKNHSLETLIIQDADAIDAIGEIGLERTLKYCRVHNIPITNPHYPLDCKEYVPNTNPISTCHYIYNTMISEGKNLYTKTARILAKDKVEILEKFVKDNYICDKL